MHGVISRVMPVSDVVVTAIVSGPADERRPGLQVLSANFSIYLVAVHLGSDPSDVGNRLLSSSRADFTGRLPI